MINMANESSAPFLTSSQESMVLESTIGLDLHDLHSLNDLLETTEAKYDTSQHLLGPDQQQQHQVSILPEFHMPQAQLVPTNEEFPGPFNFELDPDQQDNTKSWVFAPKLKKVFIEMGKTLPIRMKWSTPCPGLFVKAVMVFCQSTHRSEPVTRCPNHIASSSDKGIPHVHHILSCKHPNAVYTESNGHFSVLVPLGVPQPGSDSVQVDFMFHCKNSCTGVNRRATEVVFTLENDAGDVLGRRKLLVRICSCPKRDSQKEERARDTYPSSVSKKRKLPPGKKGVPVYREQPAEPDNEIFHFSARIYGRENYELVKRVCSSVLLETMIRTGQQAIIKPLLDELNNSR